MVRLQLVELMGGVVDERRMVVRDYLPEVGTWSAHDALEVLSDLETDQLLDLDAVVSVLHLGGEADDLDEVLQPRGYRMLSRIPRLSETMIDRLVDRFGLLDKLLRASIEDLESIEGMGALRARSVRDGLSRLAETSILDRYS
jgi:diadenylate cyclase